MESRGIRYTIRKRIGRGPSGRTARERVAFQGKEAWGGFPPRPSPNHRAIGDKCRVTLHKKIAGTGVTRLVPAVPHLK
jgi:hypothetical protein